MRRRHGRQITTLAALIVLSSALGANLRAGDTAQDAPTVEERRLERGIELREDARARAGAHLGYPLVLPTDPVRGVDYFALSQQIARLAALLQLLDDRPQASPGHSFLPATPGWAGPGGSGQRASVTAIYGPNGPTEQSVRLLLEYRLMVAGNPRLKVGEVRESEDRVVAQIVTADGSLVDEYVVDKSTGIWTPVR